MKNSTRDILRTIAAIAIIVFAGIRIYRFFKHKTQQPVAVQQSPQPVKPVTPQPSKQPVPATAQQTAAHAVTQPTETKPEVKKSTAHEDLLRAEFESINQHLKKDLEEIESEKLKF